MAKNAIYINDSIHGLIRLSEYEKRIISSIGFNRLHDVYQNSTVYLTYPTNRTKRFEHSIGTMKLCTDMFYNSILNASKETLIEFFDIAKSEINDILDSFKSIDASRFDQFIKGIPRDKDEFWENVDTSGVIATLFPRSIPVSSDKTYDKVYAILMQSIRVAALLHDIGHPPYSHVVEEAMMETYRDIKTGSNAKLKQTDFYKIIDSCVSGEEKAALHEKMGVSISHSILYTVISRDKDKDNWKNMFEIVVRECVNKIFTGTEPDFFDSIHRIIDSDLDGDRLDYVTRDPINSGMSCGCIDYSRLILDMKLIIKDRKPLFCIPLKAINTAEDFFQRRFNIYKNIIYHHRVKKTDYLLKDVVFRLLDSHLSRDVNQKRSNKSELVSISGLWRPLSGGTSDQVKSDLSQWNDSWLMTFLKKEYYDKYEKETFDIDKDKNEYVLKKEMEELLCNVKHFYSMIKRSEDHNVIDVKMYQTIKSKLDDEKIKSYISKFDSISKKKKKINKNIKEKTGKGESVSATIDVDGLKVFLKEIIDARSEHSQLWLTFEQGKSLDVFGDDNWEKTVRKCVNNACEETFRDSYIENILVFNKFKIGVTGDVNFYDKKDETHSIIKVSNIHGVIKSEYRFLPKIYLYVLTKDDDVAESKKEELLSSIGEKLGNKVVERINKAYEELVKNNETSIKPKTTSRKKSGTNFSQTNTKARTKSTSSTNISRRTAKGVNAKTKPKTDTVRKAKSRGTVKPTASRTKNTKKNE